MKIKKASDEYTLYDSWMSNAYLFVKEAIGVESISNQQKEALVAVSRLVNLKINYDLKVEMTKEEEETAQKIGISIMSGRGCGKDAFAAWVILWFLFCFNDETDKPKIPCIGPNETQLKTVLWDEIRKWLAHSKKIYGKDSILYNHIVYQKKKVYMDVDAKGDEAVGAFIRTVNTKSDGAEQVAAVSGLHSEYMMCILDEAPGIPEAAYNTLRASLTQKVNFILMIFNPTKNTGYTYDSHYNPATSKSWITLKWNAEESDNISKVGKDFIKEMETNYGRDSDIFRVSVLGLPPTGGNGVTIPIDSIYDAVRRTIIPSDHDLVSLGVDVASDGEDVSVIAARKGYDFRKFITSNSNELDFTDELSEYLYLNEPDITVIDSIGYGGTVLKLLRQRGHYKVKGFCSSSSAYNLFKYENRRAEIWLETVRPLFLEGLISIPNDPQLIAELSIIRHEISETSGKTKLWSKRALRKEASRQGKQVKSPNKADALAYSLSVRDASYKTKDLYEDSDDYEFEESGDRDSWMLN